MNPWIIKMSRNHGTHNVARPKRMLELLRFRPCSREAMLIHQTHLSAASPVGFDEQRNNPLDPETLRCTLAHTRCITPVGLGKGSLAAVKLREAARSALDWQTQP
jgi:hypothetical protein